MVVLKIRPQILCCSSFQEMELNSPALELGLDLDTSNKSNIAEVIICHF